MARAESVAAIGERFGVKGRWPKLPASSLLRAGDAACVVRAGVRGRREIVPMRWGLMLEKHPLAEGAPGPLTTVASRSIHRAALLQDLFPSQRCIVPVGGFFAGPVAWAKTAPEWEFRLIDDGIIGIAGLWFGEPGKMESFAIITTGPNESVALIEEAMPAILLPRDEAAWLSPRTDPYRAHRLIMPYPAEQMRARPVPAASGADLLHAVA
jgi:putative SOS response-associated peptidase YedK